jgi:hypothetical protein
MSTSLVRRLKVVAVAVVAGSAFFVGISGANAQSQTVNYTASVTVRNTFTVGQTTPLNLGTIAAVADPTQASTQATLVLAGNSGTSTITNPSSGSTARLLAISAATPGVISITNAPPSTLFTITQGSTVQLDDPASATNTKFDFAPSAVCAGFNCTTNASGALTVNVGGTLTTRGKDNAGESGGYSDGTYTGTYSITFAF